MQILDEFVQFIKETCSPDSNLPGSYMRALRHLSKYLHELVPQYATLPPIWMIDSLDTINELYLFTKAEERKGEGSSFYSSNLPKSYLKNRFCSNALKTFGRFLSETKRISEALKVYSSTNDASSVAHTIERIKVKQPQMYLNDEVSVTSKEGKDVIRHVRLRQNQDIFRRMVLMNYENTCCVTGLPVREALRASHIVGWQEDKSTRLLPTNGLCLAATYDAVFDRHLISFDEDFRMILSPSLKEYFSNAVFVETFKKFEGAKLISAKRFQPSQEFLQRHREQLR